MSTDHNKIVEEIQRKMAGPSMLKSQQQKKQQIFQYQMQQDSQLGQSGGYIKDSKLQNRDQISINQAQNSLKQIYNFYVNSYIQPRQHFQTFDSVNERKLTFQPYILFAKHFMLLKTIYSLQKMKLFFKKYSNFGQYLTLENFIFMVKQISHEPEAKKFFHLDENKEDQQDQQNNVETQQQKQLQQMFHYLHLQNTQAYRSNFKSVFEPFFCKQKANTPKIKYTYRKFSQPQLLKKSLPSKRNETQQKQLYVVKNKDVQMSDNPFGQIKSIVVSWQSLRSKSLLTLQKTSADIIKKKYIKQDPDDEVYLRQYEGKQKQQRKRLQQKISEIAAEKQEKDKIILAKIQNKTQAKSLLIKKKN